MKHRLTRSKFYGPYAVFIDIYRGLNVMTKPDKPGKRLVNERSYEIELGDFWKDDNEFS